MDYSAACCSVCTSDPERRVIWSWDSHVSTGSCGKFPLPQSLLYSPVILWLSYDLQHFVLNVHIMFGIDSQEIEGRTIPQWYSSIGKAKFVIYVTQTIIGDGFMVGISELLSERVCRQPFL